MNRLPSEREDQGLQSVFKSVFPISDFRENSSLEFIEYSIGNWECKCGKLQGLHHLRKPCKSCGHTLICDPYGDKDVLCPKCGTGNQTLGTGDGNAQTFAGLARLPPASQRSPIRSRQIVQQFPDRF
jgi:hypothetical protein